MLPKPPQWAVASTRRCLASSRVSRGDLGPFDWYSPTIGLASPSKRARYSIGLVGKALVRADRIALRAVAMRRERQLSSRLNSRKRRGQRSSERRSKPDLPTRPRLQNQTPFRPSALRADHVGEGDAARVLRPLAVMYVVT